MSRAVSFVVLTGILLSSLLIVPPAQAKTFPDAGMKPVPGWRGPVFELRQDYPRAQPKPENYPWKRYDFRTQWREYMMSVLRYCYEGNLDVDWVVQKNRVRRWYHAPWMHWGRNGREFVHGLTHERVSEPQELAPTQTSRFQNWAVGMYNAPGGYVVGRVWRNPEKPDASQGRFPDGTVSVKLLFTEGTVEQVPYLKGTKEWRAYIYRDIVTDLDPLLTVVASNPHMPRAIRTMRLLQIDIAVRDTRADATTGWILGTFVYNGNAPGNTPWDRMVPVGLMWGNDPDLTAEKIKAGAKLRETIINPSNELPHQHLGYGGRLDGPVDDPLSSCLSCHSTAQAPAEAPLVPYLIQAKPDSPEWMRWFRNIKSGEAFSPGARSLDYSLQLAVGVQNFEIWNEIRTSQGGAFNSPSDVNPARPQRRIYPVTRQGTEPSMPASVVQPSEPPEGEKTRSMRSWITPAGALIPILLGLFVAVSRRFAQHEARSEQARSPDVGPDG
jgi:hypothetical protein